MKKGIREHREKASMVASIAEVIQLFQEKEALKPMKEENLHQEERKNIIGSCIFLKEKFDAKRNFRNM